jgi:hypothetical protein
MAATETGEEEETILEYSVRERLTKDQLAELLSSLGGQRQGSRDELAERLLAIRGLKPRDALSKLPSDDLRLLVRRFSIPEPAKPSGLLGFANSFVSDERSALVKRIEEVAIKQRAPIPRASSSRATPEPKPAPTAGSHSAESVVVGKPTERPLEVPIPAAQVAPATPVVAGAPGTGAAVGLPVFQETRDFVGSYKFAYQWDSEDLYEAELLGALRGRFGINNAIRQQGESGRVYDIVVRNSARIEVKLPKQKAELDRMIGQVRRYITQHPGGVIVVIIGFMMKNQQEIHNSQEELESAGAVVFVK